MIENKGYELLYSTMSYITNMVASPLVHVPLIVFMCWLIKRAFKTHSKLPSIIAGVAAAWLVMCSLPYPSSILIQRLENHYPSVDYDNELWQQADAIVVLACSFYDEPELPFVSRWHDCSVKRNIQAALMYGQKQLPIYLSGGITKASDKTHASFNQDFLTTFNVPQNNIYLVEEGFNTASEARALSYYLEGKTIALVTSASHQIRATNYFERHNITVIQIPVDYLSIPLDGFTIGKPSATNLYRSERAIHEYLGIIRQSMDIYFH